MREDAPLFRGRLRRRCRHSAYSRQRLGRLGPRSSGDDFANCRNIMRWCPTCAKTVMVLVTRGPTMGSGGRRQLSPLHLACTERSAAARPCAAAKIRALFQAVRDQGGPNPPRCGRAGIHLRPKGPAAPRGGTADTIGMWCSQGAVRADPRNVETQCRTRPRRKNAPKII